MTHYMAIKSTTEGEEGRRNRSKRRLEIPPARTKAECHSARFGHFALHRHNQPECARPNAESARIVTPRP